MDDDGAAAAPPWAASNNIHKIARRIKRQDSSLYNALRSIVSDSAFVREIAALWPTLPLVANLRCGLWYSPEFDASCYFKSTDGHAGNWGFSTSRLNLHLALLAGEKGGCIIVDSTRKGKRFPDSMSKTIPMWACVLNRAVARHQQRILSQDVDWDISLHLPLWVSNFERIAIEQRLEEWTDLLESSGADIGSLFSTLKKPFRPLWISQRTVIWLNEVPNHNSWDFTPIILLNASSPHGNAREVEESEFSWHYIPGAADDEESWARGLSPQVFWKHAYEIIDAGPAHCNLLVADVVEKDRVYRAYRGESVSQVTIKSSKNRMRNDVNGEYINHCSLEDLSLQASSEKKLIFWLSSTNVAVCSTLYAPDVLAEVDCILNCDGSFHLHTDLAAEYYLHLPLVNSKEDRFSLLNNLDKAVNFARANLSNGRKLLICCHDGEDISICVSLAILTCLYDEGCYDGGKAFENREMSKWELRKQLVFVCKSAVNARPSRGNLKQVYNFLRHEKERMGMLG